MRAAHHRALDEDRTTHSGHEHRRVGRVARPSASSYVISLMSERRANSLSDRRVHVTPMIIGSNYQTTAFPANYTDVVDNGKCPRTLRHFQPSARQKTGVIFATMELYRLLTKCGDVFDYFSLSANTKSLLFVKKSDKCRVVWLQCVACYIMAHVLSRLKPVLHLSPPHCPSADLMSLASLPSVPALMMPSSATNDDLPTDVRPAVDRRYADDLQLPACGDL